MTASLDLGEVEAAVFDLDGVLTDTAVLHRKAWKQTFDKFFEDWAAATGKPPPRPFTDDDYRRRVDGESRLDGVRHVLADRGVELPDAPDVRGASAPARAASRPRSSAGGERKAVLTTVAVAEAKDTRYLELLREEGPRPFPASVALLERLRKEGVSVAVVSASRHCAEVLEAAGLTPLVDARVDGLTAAAMELPGKPDPALFLEALHRLGSTTRHAVVFEDAVAGVEAGARGGFATVVGVDRVGQAPALREAGASLVVGDLGELHLDGRGPAGGGNWLVYDDPSPDQEGLVETLGVLANGYLATRAARPWAGDDGVSYPGTYLAGLYNRLWSTVNDEDFEFESIVNMPNWLHLVMKIDDGPFLGSHLVEVEGHRITVDLRHGVFTRRCVLVDRKGRHTAFVERRLVSMAQAHLAAQRVSLIPLDWSGALTVRSSIDGGVLGDETLEERQLSNRHLGHVDQGKSEDALWLRVRTVQSQILVGMAAGHKIVRGAADGDRVTGAPGQPAEEWRFPAVTGVRICLEKTVAVHTTRDMAISEPGQASRQLVGEAGSFDQLERAHCAAWDELWSRVSVPRVDFDHAETLRLHLFHLLQVASPHFVDLDAGLSARGLHGEGYLGHIFWDTVFIGPVFSLRFPEVVRASLAYRYRRLPAAKRLALQEGRKGAMFPWQSGSDGRDETPKILFNPRSGRWMADWSRLERHVGLAIAYEVWQHWQMTNDAQFMATMGASLFFDIARCFVSLTHFDRQLGRYRISHVMGPDEFHDGYPWSKERGLTDNAYTNVMTAWLLCRAIDLAGMRQGIGGRGSYGKEVDEEELAVWDEVSRRLYVPFHDGVISQFAGWEKLKPLDLDEYKERYGNIGRLDLILEAEGDSVAAYQVSKQADVLMLLYLFSAEELRTVFERLGYELEPSTILRTIDYYAQRVSHGSTLSRVVHAWVMARADRAASWRYFQMALTSDVADQSGTTREGVHLGAMAGTIDILERCYSGLEVRDDALWLNPVLPPEVPGLGFALQYRGLPLQILIDHQRVRVEAMPSRAGPVRVMVLGEPHHLGSGEAVESPISP